jgi:hypothetical protein
MLTHTTRVRPEIVVDSEEKGDLAHLAIFEHLDDVASCCLDDEVDARRVEDLIVRKLGLSAEEAEVVVRANAALALDYEEDRMILACALFAAKEKVS